MPGLLHGRHGAGLARGATGAAPGRRAGPAGKLGRRQGGPAGGHGGGGGRNGGWSALRCGNRLRLAPWAAQPPGENGLLSTSPAEN